MRALLGSRIAIASAAHAAAMMAAQAAAACPDCPAARTARAWAFGAQFWTNLGSISAPLVVLALVAALLYRIGRPTRAKEADE